MDKYTEEDIKAMKPEDLAAIVVIYRVLGNFKEDAKLAMIELMRRNGAGDAFDFDKFIELNAARCKINLSMPSFASMKNTISSSIFQTLLGVNAVETELKNKANDLSHIIGEDDEGDI